MDRLRKHMSLLSRGGHIETWYDRQISGGEVFEDKIKNQLEECKIFLALISPDYLASKYCYDIEFEYAMSRASQSSIRIVPIILEPCDWLSSPFSQFMALPKDGLPISEWTNQNNAFLDIVTGLRRLVGEFESVALSLPVVTAATTAAAAGSEGRRPRIKRDFDAIDKSDFADKTYGVIRTYFEGSCGKFNRMDGDIRAKFENMSAIAFTCTVVNRAKIRGGEAHITVFNSKGKNYFGDINYAYEKHAEGNSSHGAIRISADEYNLFLSLDNFGGTRGGDKHTAEQAADWLWLEFVRRAGIDYE